MTNILITDDGDYYTIILTGHAANPDGGVNIPCMQLSILAQSLLNYVLNVTSDVMYRRESGYLKMKFPSWDRIKPAVGVFESGIALIKQTYPNSIE